MRAHSSDKTTENSPLIGRGGLLEVTSRAKTVPPNLAETCLKGVGARAVQNPALRSNGTRTLSS
jgi:hypothetical protein